MYTKDDQQSAKIGDRIIAAVIAAFFGYFAGWLFASVGEKVLGDEYGLRWLVVGGFSVFAFLAPTRSRELWGAIWASIVRISARLYGWRG